MTLEKLSADKDIREIVESRCPTSEGSRERARWTPTPWTTWSGVRGDARRALTSLEAGAGVALDAQPAGRTDDSPVPIVLARVEQATHRGRPL